MALRPQHPRFRLQITPAEPTSNDQPEMITIRLMREEDASAVRRVDALAFGTWWRQLTGDSAELPQRTHANVLALRKKDPEGCFVAEEDGRVLGFVFSRTWGGVGWFGTFAVLPEYQGRGIGRQLIAASLDYLRQDPGRVIGLETMPESPYNLGLYLRRGFQARLPTFLLSKPLTRPTTDGIDLPYWSSVGAKTRERWLTDLREATGRIQPRLDYTKEIVSTARHDVGKTLMLTDGARAVGLSTVWLLSSREGQGEELASVQVLALHPAYTDEDTFRVLLGATEDLACARGKQKLALPVNGRYAWGLERLLGWGYRVERAMVRMVLEGTDGGPSNDGHVNLSRWAG
jgi:ribosomal protein S18 acetylase RimI-like enzyme